MLQFAFESGAIGKEEQVELVSRGGHALAELVAPQTRYLLAGDTAQGSKPASNKLPSESMATERTKKEKVVGMLNSASGATLAEIMAATGWQKHTVRGFLSGTAVRQMGLPVSSFKRDGRRVYRRQVGGLVRYEVFFTALFTVLDLSPFLTSLPRHLRAILLCDPPASTETAEGSLGDRPDHFLAEDFRLLPSLFSYWGPVESQRGNCLQFGPGGVIHG